MLEPYLLYIKLGAAALLLTATSYGTYKVTSNHYIVVAQQRQIDIDRASAKLIAEKDANILKGAQQHETDQGIINSLGDAVATRLPIHIPARSCTSAKGSTDSSAASGVLSTGVDAALEHLLGGTSKIIQQCDQLNIDARQSNEANK